MSLKRQAAAQLPEGVKRTLRWLRHPGRLPQSKKTGVLLPQGRRAQPTRRCLAAVAIMWNEALDLVEWIEFHRLVGFEHIYLYDDGSTDGSADLVRPYVDSGFVTYIPWTMFTADLSQQKAAYAHAICAFGGGWRWMAFFDLDEYLFPLADESLRVTLSRYDDLPAVVVPWKMFGFCGHKTRPSGLIVENYLRRVAFPPSPQFNALLKWKSIVDPLAVAGVYSAHFFTLADGRKGGFTEKRIWVDDEHRDDRERLSADSIQLNHYFTKSKEDFVRRRAGGRDVGKSPERAKHRSHRVATLIEAEQQVVDKAALRYADALRSAVARAPGVPV